jgi:F0F1-type ATP synthase delta subunit
MITSAHIQKFLIKSDKKNLDEKILVDFLIKFTEKYHLQYLIPKVISNLSKVLSKNEYYDKLKIEIEDKKNIESKTIDQVKKQLNITNTEEVILEKKGVGLGFIATYKDKILDASSKNQLNKLAKKLQ